MAKNTKITLVILLFGLACGQRPEPQSVREAMQNAYQDTKDLYGYLWTPGAFSNPENKQRIQVLLERLSSDFHNVKNVGAEMEREPGFQVSLATHRSLLSDVERQFRAGNIDYSAWKLRGLTASCIGCHSRQRVFVDFLGDMPSISDSSVESQQAQAEFLFASRQFEASRDKLVDLATLVGKSESGGSIAFDALKLWLVIEVRVRSRFAKAAYDLSSITKDLTALEPYEAAFLKWKEDLNSLAKTHRADRISVKEAERLLIPVLKNELLKIDEQHLVTTLAATAVLHQFLETPRTAQERRKAVYLLALAYGHIPISALELFEEFYLEQCIREFPETQEARTAYIHLEDLLEQRNSGSSGIHMDEKDLKRLGTLRRLAFGSPEQILSDTLSTDEQS